MLAIIMRSYSAITAQSVVSATVERFEPTKCEVKAMNRNTDLWVIGVVLAIAVIGWGLGLGSAPGLETASSDTQVAVEQVDRTGSSAESLILVTPLRHLEMLDPIYSEKAVYADDTIMIAFKVPLTEEGIAKSELGFQLENRSESVIQVVWDECSIQLPGADTVNIMHEETRYDSRSFSTPPTSIAPGGDIIETVVPISEVCRDEDTEQWYITDDILDNGEFFFVLAIRETGNLCSESMMKYYSFRFVIR